MSVHAAVKKITYQPSNREKAFLDTVENAKYDRQIISGMKKFTTGKVPQDMVNFYSAEELEAIQVLKGSGHDVEARMPVKITGHYFNLAKTSQ